MNTTNVYPLSDVMAYAVMAYDTLGDYYASPHYEDEVRVPSNKDFMKNHLGVFEKSRVDEQGNPDFQWDTVPDEDQRERASEIVSYYTGLMFKAIGGQINSFEQRVLDIVKGGEVAAKDFGIVASLPKSWARSVERERVEQEQRRLSDESRFVGSEGMTLDLKLRILRVNRIERLGCHVVNAVDEHDNLIVFFTGNPSDFDVVDDAQVIAVRGRVKRHQTSKFHGGCETVLNYVKAV